MSVWKAWCKEKKIYVQMRDQEPEVLNKNLETFYAEIKTKDGRDYKPGSLRVMIAALDRKKQTRITSFLS